MGCCCPVRLPCRADPEWVGGAAGAWDPDHRRPKQRRRACRRAAVPPAGRPVGDTAFWRRIWDDGLDGTPLYYRPFLEQKPERCAAAVAAVADARPGGILIHCTIGRDRAGLVTLLLLALAGVAPADIADDWELSNPRLEPLRAGFSASAEALARRNPTTREVVVTTLEAVDVEAVLRAGGLSDRRLRAVRDRLLEPAGPATGGRPRATGSRSGRRSGEWGR